jgi:hypothetical protein
MHKALGVAFRNFWEGKRGFLGRAGRLLATLLRTSGFNETLLTCERATSVRNEERPHGQ